MSTKRKNHFVLTNKLKKLLGHQPNQCRAPGEIQGYSKHLKPNKGQGRGQRVKAPRELSFPEK